MKQIELKNETGTYFCDEAMCLSAMEPQEANCLYRSSFGLLKLAVKLGNGIHQAYAVRDLIIPEGIRSIGSTDHDFFDTPFYGTVVTGRLRFPSTLESVGNTVFLDSLIMELELPGTLRYIGSGAFMRCYIQTLRIGAGLREPVYDRYENRGPEVLICGGRQFKQTIIGTLIIPADYPYKRLMPEALIDQVITY